MKEALFVAIDIGEDARKMLTATQRLLVQAAGQPDLISRMENPLDFHITLRYFGTKLTREQAIAQLERIRFAPFQLESAALGVFLSPDPPVIWSGVQGDIAALRSLQAQVDAVFGISDGRGYTPHITLAYLNYPIGGLQKEVQNPSVQFPAQAFGLYRIAAHGSARKFEQVAVFPAMERESAE